MSVRTLEAYPIIQKSPILEILYMVVSLDRDNRFCVLLLRFTHLFPLLRSGYAAATAHKMPRQKSTEHGEPAAWSHLK